MAKAKAFKNLFTALGNLAQSKAPKKVVSNVVNAAGNAGSLKTTAKLGSGAVPTKAVKNVLNVPNIRGKPIGEALSKVATKSIVPLAIGGGVVIAANQANDIITDFSQTKAQRNKATDNEIDAAAIQNQSDAQSLNESWLELLGKAGQFNTDPNSPSAYNPSNFFTLPSQDETGTESANGSSGIGSLLLGAALIGGGYYAYKKFYKKGKKK